MTSYLQRLPTVLFLLTVLASCREAPRSRPEDAGTRPSRIAAADEPARAELAAEDIVECARDTTARHEDPEALLTEWVRRDAEGPMERQAEAARWRLGALGCIEADTSDHAEIISSFEIRPLRRAGDTAHFAIHRLREYRVVVAGSGSPRLEPDRRAWVDTALVMRHGRLGWRIARLSGGAHQFPEWALVARPGWSRGDSLALAQLGAQRRRATSGGA